MDYIQIQAGVFMHGHVAEADHVLHAGGQIGWDNARCLQKSKCVTRVLWNAKLPLAHNIHSEIDGRFASPLKIQHDRVLLGLIRNEVLLVSGVFILNALKASLDAGGFVKNYIVSHTPARAS